MFFSIGQLLKQSVSVCRWRRQGERKERETHYRRGWGVEQRHHAGPHIPKTPLSLFSLRRKRNAAGTGGESKNVHLHPPALRSLSPISSLSVVKIYHYCAPSSSSYCFFTQGSRADISVRWLGFLCVTVNWPGRRGKRHYCAGRNYQRQPAKHIVQDAFTSCALWSPHRTSLCRAKNYICLANTVVLWAVLGFLRKWHCSQV